MSEVKQGNSKENDPRRRDDIKDQVHRMNTEHKRLQNDLSKLKEENDRLREENDKMEQQVRIARTGWEIEEQHINEANKLLEDNDRLREEKDKLIQQVRIARTGWKDEEYQLNEANMTVAYQRGQLEATKYSNALLQDQKENDKGNVTQLVKQKIPLRHPDVFRTGGNFRRWVQSFKNFASTAEIPNNKKINTLITFLDERSQIKIGTLKITEEMKQNVDECLELITKTLDGITQTFENRHKLYSMKQEPQDSITDFGCKLLELADQIYGPEKLTFKDQIMLDIFIAGLKSDDLAIELIKKKDVNFQEVYKLAVKLESIYTMRGNRQVHNDTASNGMFQIMEQSEHNEEPDPTEIDDYVYNGPTNDRNVDGYNNLSEQQKDWMKLRFGGNRNF